MTLEHVDIQPCPNNSPCSGPLCRSSCHGQTCPGTSEGAHSGPSPSEGAHPGHLSLSHRQPRPSPPQSTHTTGNPNPSTGASTQHPHPALSCPGLRQRCCRPRNRRLIGIPAPALRPRRSRLDSRRR
jgi:hypothetical protein